MSRVMVSTRKQQPTAFDTVVLVASGTGVARGSCNTVLGEGNQVCRTSVESVAVCMQVVASVGTVSMVMCVSSRTVQSKRGLFVQPKECVSRPRGNVYVGQAMKAQLVSTPSAQSQALAMCAVDMLVVLATKRLVRVIVRSAFGARLACSVLG